MVWYNKSTVTGVRTGIVTLSKALFFHFLKSFTQGREITASYQLNAG